MHIKFVIYRWRMRRTGVHIAPGAYILGGSGIIIGRGTLIHRNAAVAATAFGYADHFSSSNSGEVMIGENCQVYGGEIIASYGGFVKIGDNVSINPYTILYGMGGVRIGQNTRIAAHTVVISANHNFEDPTTPNVCRE